MSKPEQVRVSNLAVPQDPCADLCISLSEHGYVFFESSSSEGQGVVV